MSAPLAVVGAVIVRDGAVLAARRRRPPGWEFPGGKLEPGESPAAALMRECNEELGVVVAPVRPLAGAGDGRIALDVWLARLAAGEPAPGADHDQVAWLTPDRLGELDWLPLDAMVLPDVRKALQELDNTLGPGTPHG